MHRRPWLLASLPVALLGLWLAFPPSAGAAVRDGGSGASCSITSYDAGSGDVVGACTGVPAGSAGVQVTGASGVLVFIESEDFDFGPGPSYAALPSSFAFDGSNNWVGGGACGSDDSVPSAVCAGVLPGGGPLDASFQLFDAADGGLAGCGGSCGSFSGALGSFDGEQDGGSTGDTGSAGLGLSSAYAAVGTGSESYLGLGAVVVVAFVVLAGGLRLLWVLLRRRVTSGL
jgi:hypothetical protein